MMDDSRTQLLNGLRVLVVEDEHLVALALCDDMQDAGIVVVGPAATVGAALALIDGNAIDAAVLDIKLQAEMVFPVAEKLAGLGVPFLFTTGFDAGVLPRQYANVPKCEKPSSTTVLIGMLAALVGRGG